MKKLLLATVALASIGAASAATFPANTTPAWKSYMATGNTADIVSSPTVAAAIGLKVDATSGQSLNQTLQTPTITGGTATGVTINSGILDDKTTIAGKLVSGIVTLNSDGYLDLPYATYGAPLSGSSMGTGAFSFIAPNPTIQGGATFVGMSPIIHLTPVNAYSSFDIWADQSGNAQFSTGRPGAGYSFYTSGGTFDFHGAASGNSAQINLYGYGNATPASIWQDSAGGLYMTPGSTNGSTSIYANGTGGVAVYSSTLQLHGTSGSQLQFFGASTTSHGTIWQDASENLNVSTADAGADLNLYAAANIVMKSSVIMPIGTPSSSTASCTQGQMASDDNYIYVCTSSSVWKKTALGAM